MGCPVIGTTFSPNSPTPQSCFFLVLADTRPPPLGVGQKVYFFLQLCHYVVKVPGPTDYHLHLFPLALLKFIKLFFPGISEQKQQPPRDLCLSTPCCDRDLTLNGPLGGGFGFLPSHFLLFYRWSTKPVVGYWWFCGYCWVLPGAEPS